MVQSFQFSHGPFPKRRPLANHFIVIVDNCSW